MHAYLLSDDIFSSTGKSSEVELIIMMGLKRVFIHPHFQTSSLSQELDQNQISSGELLGVG